MGRLEGIQIEIAEPTNSPICPYVSRLRFIHSVTCVSRIGLNTTCTASGGWRNCHSRANPKRFIPRPPTPRATYTPTVCSLGFPANNCLNTYCKIPPFA